MATLSTTVTAGEVLALIASGAADTRSAIARVTGLSRSTVAERLEALREMQLVEESTITASTGGRPSRRITLNHRSHLVLAADIGEDHTRLLVTDLAGRVQAESVRELAVTAGPTPALTWIADEGARLIAGLDRPVGDVLGLGLSVPAPVDFLRGQVVGPSVMTGWDGVDIAATLRERLDIPVLVENDVNARALGEYLLGWRDHDHVLYVKAGTGIGSAILTGGELFRGALGAAGDIGHIRLDPQHGPLCRCGAIGCVEAMAAGWSVVRDLRALGLDASTTTAAVRLAESGEPQAIHRLRESGRVLGRAIAYAVNMLNPGLVIVGGSLVGSNDHLMLGIREAVYQFSLSLATRDLVVARAQGDERCGAVGAAQLVIQHALEPDRVNQRMRDTLQSASIA